MNSDDKVEGDYNNNLMLDSHLYKVEFTNWSVKEYSANLIYENILTHVDEDEYSLTVMSVIINHEKDTDVAIDK